MKPEPLEPSCLKKKICDLLKDENNCFVFPTSIASTSWIEWIIKNSSESGKSAVPLERFIEWDTFKGSCFCDNEIISKNLSSIPSILRKLFVRSLIEKNASLIALGQEPLFKSLINPKPVFAENAYQFTDWISKILPSLKNWKSKYDAYRSNFLNEVEKDDENLDYITLYTEYVKYLTEHSLYEPAWQNPDLTESDKTYVFFYPELLEDYSDYKEVLINSEKILLYCLPDSDITDKLLLKSVSQIESPLQILFFSNVRTELRYTALKIKSLINTKKVEWTDIVVNVPDIETYRPYVEREFSLYNIPYVVRAAEKLIQSGAGRIFSEIQKCYSDNFSFDSVRSLVLDKYVPWKDEYVAEELVRQGNLHKCVCGYIDKKNKKIDVWVDALRNSAKESSGYRSYLFYTALRSSIESLCNAPTFSELRKQWFTFRSKFLNDEFTPEADAVLGRCISELSSLIEIESKFLIPEGIKVPKVFDFYLSLLESVFYQKQQKKAGVSILPYRLAAVSSFKYHFVINASQKALTVPYKVFSFLNTTKREQLGISDIDNVSASFLKLYALKENCIISCSKQSLDGFAILNSTLVTLEKTQLDLYVNQYKKDTDLKNYKLDDLRNEYSRKSIDALKEYDFFTRESNLCLTGNITATEKSLETISVHNITKMQKDSSLLWLKISNSSIEDSEQIAKNNLIAERLTHHSFDKDNKVTLSQTDMKNFFPCPRKWIYSCVLHLTEDTLDTDLMGIFDVGNIYHKALELYMESIKGQKLPALDDDGNFKDPSLIRQTMTEFIRKAFHNFDDNRENKNSPLEVYVLEEQTKTFTDTVLLALKSLCAKFPDFIVNDAEKKLDLEIMDSNGNIIRKYIGRIDCLLADDSGNITIVDYKLSKAPSANDCIIGPDYENNGELVDFQIPMYITLLNGQENKTSIVANALFLQINDATTHFIVNEDPSGKAKSVVIGDFKKTIDEFSKKATEMVSCLENNQIDADENKVDTYKDCSGCKFKVICRTIYTASGRNLK